MPTTLVTGATGFLGAHVVRLLVERGDEVRALVRPTSDEGVLHGLELNTVKGNVCDRRAVRRAVRGVDRVFHLAGYLAVFRRRCTISATTRSPK